MYSSQANNIFSNPSKLEEFKQAINDTTYSIAQQIDPHSDYIKVILMGITGSGKSTLACCISRKGLIAQRGKGGKIRLEGSGVKSGHTSVTRDPSFTTDDLNKIVFIDCAGFEDTKGFLQEIINAFAIDCLFEQKSNISNKFKILLVISDPEIEAGRGDNIVKSIQRLEQIFPDHEQLKNSIGLVITKSDPEINYFEFLEDGASDELKNWCDYFKDHTENIFLFPEPTKKDINKQFDFEDHERLMTFLKKDLMINPRHQLSLNENSKLQMKNLKMINLQNTSIKINAFCNKISDDFRLESNIEMIDKWIDAMKALKKVKINNTQDLINGIRECIPNSANYEDDIQGLSENKAFDSFIYKVLGNDENDSNLKGAVISWVSQALSELNKNKKYLLEAQAKEKEIEEQKKKSEEEKKKLAEEIRRNQELLDRNQKEMETCKSEMKEQYNVLQQRLEEERRNKEREMERLNEERRNHERQMERMNEERRRHEVEIRESMAEERKRQEREYERRMEEQRRYEQRMEQQRLEEQRKYEQRLEEQRVYYEKREPQVIEREYHSSSRTVCNIA